MSKSLILASRAAATALRSSRLVLAHRQTTVSVLGSRRCASFFRRNTPAPSSRTDLAPAAQPSPSSPSSSADAVLPALRTATRRLDLQAPVADAEELSSPFVVLRLQPGDSIRCSPSSLLYQTPGVTVHGDGLLVDFVNQGRSQEQLALSPEYLSALECVDLQQHPGGLVIQRGALLCAHSTVQVADDVSRAPSAEAFLGGGGFSPQRLTGEGQVVLKGGGGFYVDELLDGQSIKVTPSALVACEPTVSYSPAPLSTYGPSPSLLTLTGPGRVWLQTIPPHRAVLSSLAAGNAALVPFNAQQASALGPPQMGAGPFGFGGGGGGMMAGLGGALATGAAMGVGSELAHRAFDSFGGGHAAPAGAAPAADAGVAPAAGGYAGDQGAQGGDMGGYGQQGDVEGMRNDLPPEDSGGDGGWFGGGGLFGGGDDGGGDDGGDWSDE